MESNWRWRVVDLDLACSEYRLIASFIAGPWPGQYLGVDHDGHRWRFFFNITPAGAYNYTRAIGTALPWSTLLALGWIDAD